MNTADAEVLGGGKGLLPLMLVFERTGSLLSTVLSGGGRRSLGDEEVDAALLFSRGCL